MQNFIRLFPGALIALTLSSGAFAATAPRTGNHKAKVHHTAPIGSVKGVTKGSKGRIGRASKSHVAGAKVGKAGSGGTKRPMKAART